MERFESHINKTHSCWLWTGAKNAGGYGYYRANGKTYKAHRYAYELYRSEIPEGLVVDHLCKVRDCVNPEHLEPVTQKENLYRGDTIAAISRAKTHCKYGHEFTVKNTIIKTNGSRNCRTCVNLLKRKYRLKV